MKRTRKLAIIATTAILLFLGFLVLDQIPIEKISAEMQIREQIFFYLKQESNQKMAFDAAVKLNDEKSSNACVYFVSEVLRRNDIKVRKDTSNTAQLISALKKMGWSKDTNYRNLESGDICFTTDSAGNKDGIPTHAYIFMGWVEESRYDYAYICDNQATDYENKIYHIRNIKDSDNINGLTKDAFSFFMKPL